VIKKQLLQQLATGQISQEVFLIAIKKLESDKKSDLSYYG
jgi:hypothetical protein